MKKTYRNNRTPTRSSRMRRPTNNILARKQPMTPAEAPHMVERLQEENRSLDVFDSVLAHTHFRCFGVDVREEVAVGVGTVGAEFVEDFGEGG